MELVQIAAEVYACLQPENGLGDSNSGLIAAGGGLVVDSFWDLPRTRALQAHYASVVPDAPRTLVNTHHNGDHCWGNQLFAEQGTEIIGHERCAERFGSDGDPAAFAALCDADPDDLPAGVAGLARMLRRFDFHDIELTPPEHLVGDDGATIDLGGTEVELLSVGPAHTAGDLAVHLPDAGILFTGDVLFSDCTPVGWEGSYATWIAALERLAGLAPAVVVPGHGPVCGAEGLLEMRDYLLHVRAEAIELRGQGRSVLEAAEAIELGRWRGWNEPERIVFQVDRAFREAAGEPWDAPVDGRRLFAEAAELRRRWAAR